MQDHNSNRWIVWRENPHSPRYRLHHGISGIFLQIVPWLNIILIIGLSVVLAKRITVKPGILFTLPAASVIEGTIDSLDAVLLEPYPGEPACTFFDDIRYRIEDDGDMATLTEAMRSVRERKGVNTLTLYAAADVPHGAFVRFVNAARKSGFANINVAVAAEE